MRALILAGIAAVAVSSGAARSQDTATKPDMHAMMAMEGSNKKLDGLVAELNAAKGSDRIDALVAVVKELVAERKQMTSMMSMHARMMDNMMQKKDDQHHK